jgi:hypothetical protein
MLCLKEWHKEVVVAFMNKGLSTTQKKFHPMEGACYTTI